ncbi:hypothetical protein [Kribbella flavida]|uniref:hypothetical protein n=1 Tax=Kribbella flavida TaxID=182640 RepID=UPI00019BEFD2|nr:hypothetical protein [Kribbella flavida]
MPTPVSSTARSFAQLRIKGLHPYGYLPVAQADGAPKLVDFTEMNPSLFGADGRADFFGPGSGEVHVALLGGQLLSPATPQAMKTPGELDGRKYGLGVCGCPQPHDDTAPKVWWALKIDRGRA